MAVDLDIPLDVTVVVEPDPNNAGKFRAAKPNKDILLANTDATAAIKKAIETTNAEGGGRIVIRGPHEYVITPGTSASWQTGWKTILDLTKPTEIVGQGWPVLKLADSLSQAGLTAFSPNLDGADFLVEGIIWDGNVRSLSSNTWSPLVAPVRHRLLCVRRCLGLNTHYLVYGDAKTPVGFRSVMAQGNRVDNTDQTGGGTFGGIALHNQGPDSIITQNIVDSGHVGITVNSSNRVIVTDNILKSLRGKAIQMIKAEDVTVQGNLILGDPGSPGARVGISVFTNTPIEESHRIAILQNRISDRQIGIELANIAEDCLVDDNIVLNTVTPLVDNGKRTSFGENAGLPRDQALTAHGNVKPHARTVFVDSSTGNIVVTLRKLSEVLFGYQLYVVKVVSANQVSFRGILRFGPTNATGGTTTTLKLNTAGWTTDEWAGMTVNITSGTGAGQERLIVSNTSDTLTVDSVWVPPDSSSIFTIRETVAASALTAKDETVTLVPDPGRARWVAV